MLRSVVAAVRRFLTRASREWRHRRCATNRIDRLFIRLRGRAPDGEAVGQILFLLVSRRFCHDWSSLRKRTKKNIHQHVWCKAGVRRFGVVLRPDRLTRAHIWLPMTYDFQPTATGQRRRRRRRRALPGSRGGGDSGRLPVSSMRSPPMSARFVISVITQSDTISDCIALARLGLRCGLGLFFPRGPCGASAPWPPNGAFGRGGGGQGSEEFRLPRCACKPGLLS